MGKNIESYAKLGRMEELGGKTGVLLGMDLPSVVGGTETGVPSPHQNPQKNVRRPWTPVMRGLCTREGAGSPTLQKVHRGA